MDRLDISISPVDQGLTDEYKSLPDGLPKARKELESGILSAGV
jgi:hypothetical protein